MDEINFITLGIMLVFIGFILLFIGSMGKGDVKVGVGGFIGPIPFGWANDPEMMKWIIGLTAVIAIVFALFALRSSGIF